MLTPIGGPRQSARQAANGNCSNIRPITEIANDQGAVPLRFGNLGDGTPVRLFRIPSELPQNILLVE